MSMPLSDYAKMQSASYPNASQLQQMQGMNVAKVEERPIDGAFSRLNEEIVALSNVLSNLESKLTPYLQPESTEKDATTNAPYPVTSLTVNRILNAANDIRAAVRFINKLESRLD